MPKNKKKIKKNGMEPSCYRDASIVSGQVCMRVGFIHHIMGYIAN